MIEAIDITKQFRHMSGDNEKGKNKHKHMVDFNALDKVCLKANQGEILGLLGPNGAGKTTLLRILGKIMLPTEGRVIVTDNNGNVIEDNEETKKKIGYLSANTKLYHRFSIRELLEMFANIYGMSETEKKDRIDKITDVLGLDEFMDNRIERLSTGQMQRANIARCLIHNPDIYIFDEPTLGLDIISSKSIIDFMKSEKANGKTIIYSTHYMEEAQYLCDRIAMIHNGHIVEKGTSEELMTRYNCNNLRDAFSNIIDIKKEKKDE